TVKRWWEAMRSSRQLAGRLMPRGEALRPRRSDGDPSAGRGTTNYRFCDTFICAPPRPEHGKGPIVRSCDCVDRHGNDRPGSRTS
ncbi:hypothetical protein BO71DRAFT_297530, partial [Aspergillus ellipticus CBS 707.79]